MNNKIKWNEMKLVLFENLMLVPYHQNWNYLVYIQFHFPYSNQMHQFPNHLWPFYLFILKSIYIIYHYFFIILIYLRLICFHKFNFFNFWFRGYCCCWWFCYLTPQHDPTKENIFLIIKKTKKKKNQMFLPSNLCLTFILNASKYI